MAIKKTNTKQEASFSKGAFLNSKTYRNQRDLLDAILDYDKTYTITEVNDLLQKELNRKVEL